MSASIRAWRLTASSGVTRRRIAVVRRDEGGALLVDGGDGAQAHQLEPAAVGEDRVRPSP